ncbi:MAG: hypothetical protein ABW162_03630 [Candidatus Sedimenticola sp. PURPLELP]
MAQQLSVIYTGELRPTVTKESFVGAFCRFFGFTEQIAGALVDAGRDVVMKRNLGVVEAIKYQIILESLGMVVRLEPSGETAEAVVQKTAETPAESQPETEFDGDDTQVLAQQRFEEETRLLDEASDHFEQETQLFDPDKTQRIIFPPAKPSLADRLMDNPLLWFAFGVICAVGATQL